MCVAEALLRIPDAQTADRLIRDKLARGDWQRHLGQSQSLLVNASTWGLMLTGRLTQLDSRQRARSRRLVRAHRRARRRAGGAGGAAPGDEAHGRAVRDRTNHRGGDREQPRRGRGNAALLRHARRVGADRGRRARLPVGVRACRSRPSATRAMRRRTCSRSRRSRSSYRRCIRATSSCSKSACSRELVPALTELCRDARQRGIGLTVDAEEAERLELSLEIFARVRRDAALAGWDGFGLAVQAYQKRALAVVDWVTALAREGGWRIPLRLVKGAYWDSEIKRAQVQGLDGYPVFTRKAHTDVSYLACARRMLAAGSALYPMFATHNAHSASAIVEYAIARKTARADLEFQRLHGMGEALHREITSSLSIASRVYAPVGSHQDLLPYLVRRLLENGANTSFVNHIADRAVPVEAIIADPVARTRSRGAIPNPMLPLPRALFLPERRELARRLARRPAGDGGAGRGIRVEAGNAVDGRTVDRRPRADRRRDERRFRARASRAKTGCRRRCRTRRCRPRAVGSGARAARVGRRRRRGARRRFSIAPPRRSRMRRTSSSCCWRAKRGRRAPTRSARCARRRISAATTRRSPDASSPRRFSCLPPPANPTSCACTVAASSHASARGIFRWRFSPVRSPPRSPPATQPSPSPPSRRR